MTIENFKRLLEYLNNHKACITWISCGIITFKIDNTYYDISLSSDFIKIAFNEFTPVRLSLTKKEYAEFNLMFETLKEDFIKFKEEELIIKINNNYASKN